MVGRSAWHRVNSRVPARKSRTAERSDAGVYPNRADHLPDLLPVGQVGAQRLIAALPPRARFGEELSARPRRALRVFR